MQGTCSFDTGCRGARLLVWLILNDRVQPSFIAGVVAIQGSSGVSHRGVMIHRQAVWGEPESIARRGGVPLHRGERASVTPPMLSVHLWIADLDYSGKPGVNVKIRGNYGEGCVYTRIPPRQYCLYCPWIAVANRGEQPVSHRPQIPI